MEFFYAYSDDLTYLDQALEALLVHPQVDILSQLAVASIVRQTCIATVGVMQTALDFAAAAHPKSADNIKQLKGFLKSGDAKHEDIIRQCLQDIGVSTRPELLHDLYALKELRNALVHGNWGKKVDRRDLILRAGFSAPESPSAVDLDQLSIHHLNLVRKLFAEFQWLLFLFVTGESVPVARPLSPRRLIDALSREEVVFTRFDGQVGA